MEALSDHDLLLGIKADLKNLIKSTDAGAKSNKDSHQSIYDRLETKTDDATFKWTAGIIITILMGLFIAVGMFSTDISSNRKDIHLLHDIIHPEK